MLRIPTSQARATAARPGRLARHAIGARATRKRPLRVQNRGVIPSGEQIVLTHGPQRAVVVEVGGGLRSYALGDWQVLDGYAEDDAAPARAASR